MRSIRALLIAAVLLAMTAATAQAAPASAPAPAPAPAATTALAAAGTPAERWITFSRAAGPRCPVCYFAAVGALRAAQAIRAARVAAALRAAAALRRASRVLNARRAQVTRTFRRARDVARRGRRYLKRRWQSFPNELKGCLATTALMLGKDFLTDDKITQFEWSQYATFGPGGLQATTEGLYTAFPIVFPPSPIADRIEDEIHSCLVGIAVANKWPSSGGPQPR